MDDFSRIRVIGDQLFAFHAPDVFRYDGTEQVRAFSRFSEGTWALDSIEEFTNVSDITRFNGMTYYASIGDGLLLQESGTFLRDVPQSLSQPDTLITALSSGTHLWASGIGPQPIHRMDGAGDWLSYSSTMVFNDEFLDLSTSFTGVAWALASDGRVTIIDPDQEQIDLISTSDGVPSSILDMDLSVEDNVWVATLNGPAFFPSASFVFTSSEALRPTFDNRVLLEGQQINAVMTDGGNRVWFGTNDGLWVYDENTSEQIAVFTEENSPLPSDVILELAYNGSNGEVFVVTARGLVSYRSASSFGTGNHQAVTIFPNPVRPGYQGLVGIRGLVNNANVKITDGAGNLVQEINANGGSAAWNLLDQNGSSIATGIYYFFSSDDEGAETYVGKIAVVR